MEYAKHLKRKGATHQCFQQRELIACHKKTEQSLYQEKIHRNNLFKKNKTSHHFKFPKSQFFFYQ